METSNRATVLAGMVFTVAAASTAAQGDPSSGGGGEDRLHFGLFGEIRYDDNIGWSGDSADEVDDITTTIQGNLSYDIIKDSSREFVVTGSLFYSHVSDLSDLTNYGFIAALDYRGEFSPEFTSPWYGFHFEYTNIDFDDSEVREGYWWEAEMTLGKRFSPAFGISGGLRYFDRSQTGDGIGADWWQPDEVFDQTRWGAFAHADWFLGDSTTLYIEYSYWDGDVNSTERNPGGIFVANRDAWSRDTAFGGLNWIVWKADAKQHIGEIGADFALTKSLNLGVSALYITSQDTETHWGSIDDYSNFALMSSLSWSL